jgi:uncharacterized protein YecT (DUF1311 family)
MRYLWALLLAGLFCAPCLAQRNAGADERCSRLPSHVEVRDCLESAARQSGQDLERAQRELSARLQQWQQEPEYKRASTEALRRATERFEQFRDAQCEYVASLSAGGNSASDRRYLCLVELNVQMTRHLESERERLR